MKKGEKKHNKTLCVLFKQDQIDRQPSRYIGNEKRVEENDKHRRQAAHEILRKRAVVTALDHYNAAIIFHHGVCIRDYEIAHSLACKSAEMDDNDNALWLCATTMDRLLLAQGKKQKFGTQYEAVQEFSEITDTENWVMRLAPYDKRTSDKTRAMLGVPPLEKIIAKEVELSEQLSVNL